MAPHRIDRSPPRDPLTVLGLGNSYLSDDGVGPAIVGHLKARITDPRARFLTTCTNGFDAFTAIESSSSAIVIDAASPGLLPPGMHRILPLQSFSFTGPSPSLHSIGLGTALALRRTAQIHLPEPLLLCLVGVVNTVRFHEGCSRSVTDALPRIISDLQDRICDILVKHRMFHHPSEVRHETVA